MLVVQSNLANTYQFLGRHDDALRMRRDAYSGWLKLRGAEHGETIRAANNYAVSLLELRRFEAAKSLLRKIVPAAQRVLGENDEITFTTRALYASALYEDDCATLDDLRKAVSMLVETERTARRVLGGSHPFLAAPEYHLPRAQAALARRTT